MFRRASVIAVFLSLALSGCSAPEAEPTFRSFDLDVTHPSPYATFVAVSPGVQGARMPRERQLKSKAFNAYLRDMTGCAIDQGRQMHVIGHKKAPAGYMVPILCVK